MKLGDWITLCGVLVALAGVVLAWGQLVRARRDLVTERQADFYLTQLLTIAETLDRGPHAMGVTAHIRLLPDDLEVPFLRAWGESAFSPRGEEPLREWFERESSPGEFSSWIRKKGRAEVDAAITKYLRQRP